MDRYTACCGKDPVEFWDDPEAAWRYWRASWEDESQRRRVERTVLELGAGAGDRVLDVGAGPGVLAVPLAESGCRVTAVEPSPAMMAVLRENVDRLGLRDVRCLEKCWEEVEPTLDLPHPFRVVVCFASLCMSALESAVRKMERVCSGTLHLYWFDGTPTWDALPARLWPRLHASKYEPMPRGDVLLNVLHEMGIRPEVSRFPFRNLSFFSSPEEAVSYLAPRYLARTDAQEEVLREELAGELEHRGDAWVLPHTATCIHVWWKPPPPATSPNDQ
jgi:SAM-dependent methyltransferase